MNTHMNIKPSTTDHSQHVNLETNSVNTASSLFSVNLDDPQETAASNLLSTSFYRRVFSTSDKMKTAFIDFLQTIFYQLDENKVLSMMEEILSDPTKTDAQIYESLLEKIDSTKKSFSFLSQLKALFVVRNSLAKHIDKHLQGYERSAFSTYMEVFNRRYCNSIQKYAGLSFTNKIAVCDEPEKKGLKERVELGSFIYPYQQGEKLNDDEYYTSAENKEVKTYKPLTDAIASKSVDIITCLGGLHHTPKERLQPFMKSMHDKLTPGGIVFLQDHNAYSEDVKALASVVHSFVNASGGTSPAEEFSEIRNFQPEEYWEKQMTQAGFTRVDENSLVLDRDPTQNAMMAFTRAPKTAEELEEAAVFQKGYLRSKVGSYATWLEWGNVRFSKQYAEFIQDHHSYEFDFVGHMYQHWKHFYHSMKKSLESGMSVSEILFSDNMAMNLFILLGTTAQLGVSALTSLPVSCFAKLIIGNKETEVSDLSALEKFTAKFQQNYSSFIDYDPFFKYSYFTTIQNMWQTVLTSDDSFFIKISDVVGGIGFTCTVGVQGLLSAFINYVYYSPDSSSELETIHAVIEDPNNELAHIILAWNEWKHTIIDTQGKCPYTRCEIKVIYDVNGRKLLSLPFYKPFTQFVKIAAKTEIKFIKIGGQDKITLDLCLASEEENPALAGAEFIYGMDKLQDPQHKRYVTYEVDVSNLSQFCGSEDVEGHIEYIHVHR